MGSDLDRMKDDWLGRIAAAADLAGAGGGAGRGARQAGRGDRAAEDARRHDAGGAAERGPAHPRLREAVTEAIAARKAALEEAALEQRLATERLDMTPAGRRAARRARSIRSAR